MPANAAGAANIVTLDVYSGRPNPEWSLSDAQARELQSMIAGLGAPLNTPPAENDRLGYRGLRVTTPQAAEITVGSGHVVVQEGASVARYRDSGQRIEKWLFNTGRNKVSPDLARTIDREIAKGE